jgi:Tol biopolymer transport system component
VTRVCSFLLAAAACATAASAASAPSGKIVFASASGVEDKSQIWVMNANGTGRHPLSPATSYEDGPALSRDGRRIAFGKRGDIYVMSSSGSKVHR